jgi:hypothetical protein
MAVKVRNFEVRAHRHETASPSEPKWRVYVKVRFASEDPKNWGEFFAYACQWTKVFNRAGNQLVYAGDNKIVGPAQTTRGGDKRASSLVTPAKPSRDELREGNVREQVCAAIPRSVPRFWEIILNGGMQLVPRA